MYKLSEAAANDIEAILTRSVLDFGVERTETYFQSLTHCLELLGDNPEMGSTVDDLRQGYRCFLHESHVIFYTHNPKLSWLFASCINAWMSSAVFRTDWGVLTKAAIG